jgi:CheY-like chemotaxis protein
LEAYVVSAPRVLVIDDSPIALDITRAALELGGFEPRAASSLGEFNVILKTWSPDIVLTDVRMPGVDGGEICRWIKARLDTQRVRVLLFSDLPKEELSQIARDTGADGYISKGAQNFTAALRTFCEMVQL